MKKRVITILTTAALTAAMSMTAFAAGWQGNDETGWWYGTNDNNSQWYANGWQWIDGNGDGIAECYYFGADGYILINMTTPDGFTVNERGAWVSDGQVQTTSTNVNSGYTNKISNKVWDIMNNTYAENTAEYGTSTYPYEVTYIKSFLESEEESMKVRPYILELTSDKAPLTDVFEDAPEVNAYTTLSDIGKYLEELGYYVQWGKTSLNTTDTCWITVDRFDVAFAQYGNNLFSIKVRQDNEENGKRIADMMNTKTSVPAM